MRNFLKSFYLDLRLLGGWTWKHSTNGHGDGDESHGIESKKTFRGLGNLTGPTGKTPITEVPGREKVVKNDVSRQPNPPLT